MEQGYGKTQQKQVTGLQVINRFASFQREQDDKPGLAGKNHKEKVWALYKEELNQICPNMEQNPLGGRRLSKHRLDDYVAEM